MEEEQKYPLAISDESFDSIIEMAGYGLAYWASECSFDPKSNTFTVVEPEGVDCRYQRHTVSREKIEESFWGLANFAKQIEGTSHNSPARQYIFKSVVAGLENGQGDIDAGDIDSEAADLIIQYAVFGKIIYG